GDAVRVHVRRQRPVAEVGDEQLAEADVVGDEVALGVALVGPEDLVEVGELDLAARSRRWSWAWPGRGGRGIPRSPAMGRPRQRGRGLPDPLAARPESAVARASRATGWRPSTAPPLRRAGARGRSRAVTRQGGGAGTSGVAASPSWSTR